MFKAAMMSAAVVILTTTVSFAKGHDQGQTEQPGDNVKSETVAPAHTLGGTRGNRPEDKGPSKSRATSKGE
jgi:hypothetical protein